MTQYGATQNHFLFLEEDLSHMGLPFPSPPPRKREERQCRSRSHSQEKKIDFERERILETDDNDNDEDKDKELGEYMEGALEYNLRGKVKKGIGPIIVSKVKYWASKLQNKEKELAECDEEVDICIRERSYLDEILDSQFMNNDDDNDNNHSNCSNTNNPFGWQKKYSRTPTLSSLESQGTFLIGNKDLKMTADTDIQRQSDDSMGKKSRDQNLGQHRQQQNQHYLGGSLFETPITTKIMPLTSSTAKSGLLPGHIIATTNEQPTGVETQIFDTKLLRNLQTLLRAKQQTRRVQRPAHVVTVNKLRKRLTSIANRKLRSIKEIQKFVEEFAQWEEGATEILNGGEFVGSTVGAEGNLHSTFDNDTKKMVQMVNSVFLQDIKFQRGVAQTIKRIVDSLEYVSLKESELHTDGRNYLNDYKKYNALKTKRGPTHLETVFSLERLATTERVYNLLRQNFQRTISVTMRQQFQALSYEYYENAEAVKFAASNSIKSFLSSLEASDFNVFTHELETLRVKRETKQQCDPKQALTSQTKWEELKTGISACNDSLLREICELLPAKSDTTRERANSDMVDRGHITDRKVQPSLDFKTGLDVTYMSESPGFERLGPEQEQEQQQQQQQQQDEARETDSAVSDNRERTLEPKNSSKKVSTSNSPRNLRPETASKTAKSPVPKYKSFSQGVESKRYNISLDNQNDRGLRDKNENVDQTYNRSNKRTPIPIGDISNFSFLGNDGLHLSARTANLEENIWDQDK